MNPALQYSGEESINILLRVVDDALRVGITGIATLAEVVFILMLTLSLTFLLGHYASGGVNLPRTLTAKMVMVWFLGLVTSNWLALINLIGETFTNWGLILGGSTLAIGSFYQPAYLLLTGFDVVKAIWTHAMNGCRGPASCLYSLWATGWYMLASL